MLKVSILSKKKEQIKSAMKPPRKPYFKKQSFFRKLSAEQSEQLLSF